MNLKEKEKLFESHYEEWSEAVFRFLYYKIGDKELCEDLVHDVFVKYWNRIEIDEIRNIKNYLFTIARNLMINEVRHQKVILKYQQNFTLGSIDSPHFELETSEFKRRLENAISNLPEGQREVFLMNRIEGLKYREIAELLQISQKAVEKRMTKALQVLRKIYDKI